MDRYEQYYYILGYIDGSFFRDTAKASAWMITKNPLLGGVSPKYLIDVGRFEKLRSFVINSIDENEA